MVGCFISHDLLVIFNFIYSSSWNSFGAILVSPGLFGVFIIARFILGCSMGLE